MAIPPRSYLFVPGNKPERFIKATASGADAVVLDLEDAVAPGDKDEARRAVAAWIPSNPSAHVRINAVDTPWFENDLKMCCDVGVHSLLVPKSEHPGDIANIAERTRGRTRLLPMIESALGIWNALEIARGKNVDRLIFGSIDFQNDMAIQGDNEELLHFRSQLVLASRVARISAPVDGVTVDIRDANQLYADTLRARRLGFSGKLCIHPSQVEDVNKLFRPSPDEILWARQVTEAAEAAKDGAVTVNGQMVDKPVADRARAILAAVQAM